MRAFLFVALFACAASAAAQTPVQTTASQSDLARASQMLSANWRPLLAGSATAEAAFAAACEGSSEEMAALDASLPADLNASALSAIRAQRGLIVVPTADNPAAVYVFPNAQLSTISSGLAALRLVDVAQGRLSLTDAAGAETQLQLGVASGKAMMRILRPEGDPLLYVGCVSSVS